MGTAKNNAAYRFAEMPEVDGAMIVESGSNSDGEWTRWADGTQQINRKRYVVFDSSKIILVVYPIVFVNTDIVGAAFTSANTTIATVQDTYRLLFQPNAHNDKCIISLKNAGETSGRNVCIFATGRWK